MADSLDASLMGRIIRIVFMLRTETRMGLNGPEITIKDWVLHEEGRDCLSEPPRAAEDISEEEGGADDDDAIQP